MDITGSSPYCGASEAYIKQVQQGYVRQKLFRGPFVFFTDAVVFIYPPAKERFKSIASVVGAVAVGGEKAIDQVMELTGMSKERQVDRVNEMLRAAIYEKYGADKVTAADIEAEFGPWANTWPNEKVSRASMKMKGWVAKRLEVQIKPQSGMYRSYDASASPAIVDGTREMLAKAFGSRFIDQTH